MLYVIKSPAGRYMSTGGQYVNSSGSMARPPVWVYSAGEGWGCSSQEMAQSVVEFLKSEFGIESTVEEYK
jgi:hypothetical protein